MQLCSVYFFILLCTKLWKEHMLNTFIHYNVQGAFYWTLLCSVLHKSHNFAKYYAVYYKIALCCISVIIRLKIYEWKVKPSTAQEMCLTGLTLVLEDIHSHSYLFLQSTKVLCRKRWQDVHEVDQFRKQIVWILSRKETQTEWKWLVIKTHSSYIQNNTNMRDMWIHKIKRLWEKGRYFKASFFPYLSFKKKILSL